MINGEIKSQIDRVWNAFWTGGLSNPLTVIEQMTYLLFVKRLDELETSREKAIIDARSHGIELPAETSIFKPDEQALRWQNFRSLDPDFLFQLFRKEGGVFDFLQKMAVADSAFSRYMKGATFMIPTARLLAQVVDLLDQVEMKNRDTKGDVYEYLLSKIAQAGQNGQFRTPRHIIELMVEMTEPTLDDVIADPSAGTCGFLVAASKHIRTHFAADLFRPERRDHFQKRMFTGMEFDPTMIRIGAMNLLLHGIEQPDLRDVDALSEANSSWKNAASLVLANPPFKGALDSDAVEPSLLRTVDSKKTELLFLALLLRGMKIGARAAVIVPDGVLFGSSKAHLQIRRELIERQQLQAVISMPSGVFKPYAGVSTAILFFVKTDAGGTRDVWFYDMKADGFSLDDKRQPIAQNDIPELLKRWKNRAADADRARTEASFLVPKAEIEANNFDLSINRYKKIEHKERTFEPPAVVIERIRKIDAERARLLAELEAMG